MLLGEVRRSMDSLYLAEDTVIFLRSRIRRTVNLDIVSGNQAMKTLKQCKVVIPKI